MSTNILKGFWPWQLAGNKNYNKYSTIIVYTSDN